jgi:hypothetical protein
MQVIVVAVLVLLGELSTTALAQAPSPARCRAESAALSAAGVVQPRALPHFVEVELTLQNKAAGPIRIDPGRVTLVPSEGLPVAPASKDDVIQTLRSPSPAYVDVFGFFTIGSVGVGVGVGPIDLQARAIESRLLRAAELAPGASMKGSVYFRPASWPAQFAVVLDGLATSAGTALPPLELRNCELPVRPLTPPTSRAPLLPVTRTISTRARAEAGPLAVSVSSIELTRLATTLTVTVENTSATEASLFVAIGQAQLVDADGKTYAIRILRSDLPERVGPRSQSMGRLVFEPLPVDLAVTSVTLTMPGLAVDDTSYDLRIDLRF